MSPLARIANTLKLNRLWLALGAGALSTLALPPVFFWPVLFVTLPLMVFLLDDLAKQQKEGQAGHRIHRLRKAALMGWMFGFGFFMPTLYWIGSAFLVEAEKVVRLLVSVLVSILFVNTFTLFNDTNESSRNQVIVYRKDHCLKIKVQKKRGREKRKDVTIRWFRLKSKFSRQHSSFH